jgi:tRNA-binding EMAP/Myf-like protein
MILIFDDYGQQDGVIKNAIKDSNLNVDRYIGEHTGFKCKNLTGKEIKFITSEGVICNMRQ